MRCTSLADRQYPVVGTRLFSYFICQVKNLVLHQFTPGAFQLGRKDTISFLFHLVLSGIGIEFIYVLGLLVLSTNLCNFAKAIFRDEVLKNKEK